MGSITRATPNIAAWTFDFYWRVKTSLPDGSSLLTFKHPSTANPVDFRLRTKGIIDIKMQDGTIADAAPFSWQLGQRCRATINGTYDSVAGVITGALFLYMRGDGEYTEADAILPFSGVTDAPTNYSHGAPGGSDEVQFEVERVWLSRVVPGPYGTPPPAPPLNPPLSVLRPGVATNDTLYIAAYTGDRGPADTIGINVSTHSDMTVATPFTSGPHDSWGMNKWVVGSRTPGTRYYHQLTVNGAATGPVVSVKTTQVAGTACTIKRAVAGCQQSAPASTVCFNDLAGGNDSWVADRLIHLGDDTYPSTLTNDVGTHEISYAQSMCDTWALLLAAAGIGLNKIISDHDVNGGAYPGGNGTNFNDPTTIASLLAWAAAVPAPMDDIRSPKHARYWSEVEGNVRFVYLDQRSIERTDKRQVKGMLPDTPDTWCIDETQENWLYDEATDAAAAGQLLIVMTDTAFLGVSPVDPVKNWIATTYSDKWGSYTWQRDRIDATLADIMPITDGHPNVEIWGSDTHALQFGVSDNGIKVRTCGPLDQNLHAHYQDAYDVTYPADTKGDSETGGGDNHNTRQAQQYMRLTIVESPAGTWTVTADMRECAPKVIGDTPTTPHTDSTTYSISGDISGDHLYSLVGLPS